MYRLSKISFISLLLLLLGFQIYPQQKVVYLGLIDGEIDLGLSPYVSRVISEAEKENAVAIIFKINTFGGRVDARSNKGCNPCKQDLTIAFINNGQFLPDPNCIILQKNCYGSGSSIERQLLLISPGRK
jgi:hypothetical protein